MTEKDIINLVTSDGWMMAVLHEAEKLNLPEWMIGAGFLRNKVWDHLHGIKSEVADTNDIDLVYLDPVNADPGKDTKLSSEMSGELGLDWEIINQAYTNQWHNHPPYKSTAEAISYWIETPTCVAVTLKDGLPVIIAPHGIDDLVNLLIRPTPSRKGNLDIFYSRIESKKWLEKWPKLRVVAD